MNIDTINISPVNMDDRRSLEINAGDTVRVQVKIQEKGKTRLQAFEGLVLATKHGSEPGATFTVRKVSNGVGVERIFPLYSPNIDKIEIIKRAKVRRAKLYHIRDKVAREIKRQMRRMKMVKISSLSDTEEATRIANEEEVKIAKEKEEAEARAKAKVEEEATQEIDSSEPVADSNEEIKEETSVEEAPAEEIKEETSVEEAPAEEIKEETPVEETKVEETKKEEETEEAKKEEKKEGEK